MARQKGHPGDGGAPVDEDEVARVMDDVSVPGEDEGAEAADGEAEARPGEVDEAVNSSDAEAAAKSAQSVLGSPPYRAEGAGVVDSQGIRVAIGGMDHNRKISGPIWAALIAELLNARFK